MKLTKHTDYALRILMYAALQPEGRLLSIQEVTDTYDISRNHVMKIVQKLGHEGYLTTIRGKGGGFTLGKSPEAINLGALVRCMENTMKVVECEQPMCRISPGCELKGVFAEAVAAFMGVLNQYSLADLIGNRKELIRLLAIA
ncbi:Rrf2 family transcriptional regulator [Endozoicomonas sp. SCSIO W0465]|uniref:Rrf2 family transcriptional regulator n=1 Tax=Endozoicomonas sp. SCSIO W0465 TaxID=2918516 RepID=UPI002075A523|nr:Rrf2 family transcriptional regulator [Endozoicomonas sp. SCSIO W0465]USE35297.1 Rrf2 family transcriptional regulator [Endozoicomonas sp. SCSIO W0465]